MKFPVALLSVAVLLILRADSQNGLATKSSNIPTTQCTSGNESESVYDPADPLVIWICKNTTWTPFGLVPSTGKTKELSATSCKQIKETLSNNECTNQHSDSGVYWVREMQIYCDMTTCGGGWTLVWLHTYMKYDSLYEDMFYYSNHYQSCAMNSTNQGWCNIPNKAHFNPTEQMIVAYHKGTIVYAYKGYFNRNIDHHWTGGILLDAKQCVDRCTRSDTRGSPPAPSVHTTGLLGLSFDKKSPTDHYQNCDTYHEGTTLTEPKECRWHNCLLPSSISSKQKDTDMAIAIFVR